MSGGHAALVLAAGGSRRLGRAKQLLARDGESLLRRAVRLALATAPVRCVVVLGARSDALEAQVSQAGVEVRRNAQWQEGMGGSLALLRDAVRDDPAVDRSLILGCAQPALELAHLQALLAAAAQSGSGCAVSGYAGVRGIPAVVTQAVWRDAALQGDQGLRPVLRALGLAEVACISAPALALDVDTPADVALAVRRGWLDPVEES